MRELEDVRVRENENAIFMCEVSLEEVKGEWTRDGERIKVSSTVKIRQEGKCSKGCLGNWHAMFGLHKVTWRQGAIIMHPAVIITTDGLLGGQRMASSHNSVLWLSAGK